MNNAQFTTHLTASNFAALQDPSVKLTEDQSAKLALAIASKGSDQSTDNGELSLTVDDCVPKLVQGKRTLSIDQLISEIGECSPIDCKDGHAAAIAQRKISYFAKIRKDSAIDDDDHKVRDAIDQMCLRFCGSINVARYVLNVSSVDCLKRSRSIGDTAKQSRARCAIGDLISLGKTLAIAKRALRAQGEISGASKAQKQCLNLAIGYAQAEARAANAEDRFVTACAAIQY